MEVEPQGVPHRSCNTPLLTPALAHRWRLVRHALRHWLSLMRSIASQLQPPMTGPRSRRLVSCFAAVWWSRPSEHVYY